MSKVKVKFTVDTQPHKAGDIYECNKALASMLVTSGNAEYCDKEVKESKSKKSK